MVMENKRGWIRILEATIAVMIVAGVLLVAYSKQPSSGVDKSDYIGTIQKKILDDITIRDDLRSHVLESTDTSIPTDLTDFVSSNIPSSLSHSLKVCNFTNPPTPCKLSDSDFIGAGGAEIFVEERIIASNVTDYNPKKVRLFVWENS